MTSNSYFCCGVPTNPFDDIFCGGATQPVAQDQVKPDWDNPFGVAPPQQSPPMDARSVDTSGTGARSSGQNGDVRSVGSSVSYSSKASNLAHKSMKEISREEKARKRALFLAETLMETGKLEGENTQKKTSIGLSGNAMTAMQAESILEMNRSGDKGQGMDDRALAAKAARILALKVKSQIDKTETSREEKSKTPEDVRDPETVPGMVSRAGIAMEEDAKMRARSMISDGKYPHHEKAGIAVWSIHDTRRSRKTDGTLNPIV